MRQFFRTDICQKPGNLPVRHGIPLRQVTHGSGEFAVRSAELADDHLGDLGIGLGDVDGILQPFFIIPH